MPLACFFIAVIILHFNNVAWVRNGGRVNYVEKYSMVIRIQSYTISNSMEISRTINLQYYL